MKTQYYTSSSLDGFLATEDDSLEWLFPLGDINETSYPSFIQGVGAIAMGSSTYEWILRNAGSVSEATGSAWPYTQPTWVFTSRTLPTIEGANVTFANGDVRVVHTQMLAAANGKNVWVMGGGPIRLFQFRRGVKPGELSHAHQKDLDDILGAYAVAPKALLRSAVLLEVDAWENGLNPDAAVERLFQARDVLTLAALAKRRLFSGPVQPYCSADNFELVVQPYTPGAAGRLSYTTRRRDGGCLCGWSGDDFTFYKPKHVFDFSLDVDEPLVTWLMTEPSQPSMQNPCVLHFSKQSTCTLICARMSHRLSRLRPCLQLFGTT